MKIAKTFSENENSENKDCKTENGSTIDTFGQSNFRYNGLLGSVDKSSGKSTCNVGDLENRFALIEERREFAALIRECHKFAAFVMKCHKFPVFCTKCLNRWPQNNENGNQEDNKENEEGYDNHNDGTRKIRGLALDMRMLKGDRDTSLKNMKLPNNMRKLGSLETLIASCSNIFAGGNDINAITPWECGIKIVCEEDDNGVVLDDNNYKTYFHWNEVVCGDLSSLQLCTRTYFLRSLLYQDGYRLEGMERDAKIEGALWYLSHFLSSRRLRHILAFDFSNPPSIHYFDQQSRGFRGTHQEILILSLQGGSGTLPNELNNLSVSSDFLVCLANLQPFSITDNPSLQSWEVPIQLRDSSSLGTLSASNVSLVGSIPAIFGSFPNLQNLISS
ncbi:hypothetical protein LguiB_021693 [Lonicera macranthoides]